MLELKYTKLLSYNVKFTLEDCSHQTQSPHVCTMYPEVNLVVYIAVTAVFASAKGVKGVASSRVMPSVHSLSFGLLLV